MRALTKVSSKKPRHEHSAEAAAAALQCWEEATAVLVSTLVAAIYRLATTGVSRAGTDAARGQPEAQSQ